MVFHCIYATIIDCLPIPLTHTPPPSPLMPAAWVAASYFMSGVDERLRWAGHRQLSKLRASSASWSRGEWWKVVESDGELWRVGESCGGW